MGYAAAVNSPFRFVHTADLHLDSPLRSLALCDPALADVVANASRMALRRIIDLCLDESVNALLVAGDLYDGEQKSMHTAARLSLELKRLADAGIAVCLIRGNHDALSSITRNLSLPDNVTLFDGRGGTRTLLEGRVAIHGVSFARPRVEQSLLPKFPQPHTGCINVGLLHTSLGGASGHDVYAPCTLGELSAFGYDYWALGHVHKPAVHSYRPAVVMPGIPQARDIGEAGPHSVMLVEMHDDGAVELTPKTVGPVEFAYAHAPLDDLEHWSELPGRISSALAQCRRDCAADELVVRLRLSGNTPVAYRIERDRDLVLALARECAADTGHLWIERVDSAVQPRLDTTASAIDNTVAQLEAIAHEQVLGSMAIRERVAADVEQLLRRLPATVRQMLAADSTAHDALIDEVMRTGTRQMLATLGPDDDLD